MRPLPSRPIICAMRSGGMPLSQKYSPPISTAKPPKKASTGRQNRLMRCHTATATSPAQKETKVPSRVGRKMSAALKPTSPCFRGDALADGDDRGGDQRDARRIEHQEHDHRVAGSVLLRVDLLQLAHGLEAERGCGIVEAEHVGAGVHDDAAAGRMTGRGCRETRAGKRVPWRARTTGSGRRVRRSS